jgi:hypothetical protein
VQNPGPLKENATESQLSNQEPIEMEREISAVATQLKLKSFEFKTHTSAVFTMVAVPFQVFPGSATLCCFGHVKQLGYDARVGETFVNQAPPSSTVKHRHPHDQIEAHFT